MLDKLVCASDIFKLSEPDLSDDGAKFAGGSGDTMCGGTITCGEDFSGDNEGGDVGTEILEEVGETIEDDESFGGCWCRGELVVAKACELIVRT